MVMDSIVKKPISAFIITLNECDRLPCAINSLKGIVDEIIVVDSGSSDGTMEKARELGADIVAFNEWPGYGQQKIYAESLCKNEWILNIDADEELSDSLRKEIAALDLNADVSAYSMDCKMLLPGEKKARRFAVKNHVTRLYNVKKAGFRDSSIHDSVVVREGVTQRLRSHLNHRSFRGYEHEVEKINFYTGMQATDMLKKQRCPSSLRIIVEPFFAFLKAYFLRRYFLYGVDGFIQSIIYAFAKTLRLAKARESFRKLNG